METQKSFTVQSFLRRFIVSQALLLLIVVLIFSVAYRPGKQTKTSVKKQATGTLAEKIIYNKTTSPAVLIR